MLNTFIRHSVLVSGLLIGATALFNAPAFATTTEQIPIGGTVASTLDLTATATSNAASLPLGGSGVAGVEQIQKVADLNIHTNNATGYTISISSGNMLGSRGGSIAFQVAMVNDNAAAASGDFTVASGTARTYATNAANAMVDGNRDSFIRYTPAALQNPGNYTANVNISVTDN